MLEFETTYDSGIVQVGENAFERLRILQSPYIKPTVVNDEVSTDSGNAHE